MSATPRTDRWTGLRHDINKLIGESRAMETELAAVTKQRDELAEALRFYADTSKYPSPLTGGMGALYFDCGSTATNALNKLNQ